MRIQLSSSIIKIEISLSDTLNALKDSISSSDMGPVDRDHQRLFHLGRELKSGGRTLSTLGVGKFKNFHVHLHSTQPKTIDLSEVDADYEAEIEEVGDDNDVVEEVEPQPENNGEAKRNPGVIDLVDDNDHNDDGEVEIIEDAQVQSSNKRRKRK